MTALQLSNWGIFKRHFWGEYGRHSHRAACYPVQTLLRALLLGIWYGLSDEQLAVQLGRDLLFRKFCRLELDADTPDATTIGRFRSLLEAEGRLAALSRR